ncbi:MAG: lactate utilization protein [bacterium]
METTGLAYAEVPQERIVRTLQALKKNEFLAFFAPSGKEAVDLVLPSVREGSRVGLGGSQTLRDLALPEAVKAKGAHLLDHWQEGLGFQELIDVRKGQLVCDVFLSSVNAVTEEGELVSRDGIGNRTSAMTFGPSKVFLLVGVQKIVEDLHAAFRRVREVAAPLRARSLNLDLPCAKNGECVDCSSPNRICRATLILHRRPMLTDITVVLIGQSIGY